MTEETLFAVALEKGTPAERAAFLDEACSGDVALRQRVDALLRSHEHAEFLKTPAVKRAGEEQVSSHLAAEGLPATLDPPNTAEHTGTVIGPYKLLQQIGEGGMGAVFMAEQTHPVQRKVALKVIKAGMDSRQVIARFEAERQALAMMDHVNIARVLDAGATESGRPYFVMELVHGVPITKYCDDNHLTPRQRLELFVPVCQAIQHAHQKGIIHRDIKPSNVMITLYDGKPVPKVIDFGVAKATEQKLTERTLFTQYGTMVGTLEYMSPEQAETSALGADTRSDIYSLGVLLYELLTGSTPLTRKRVREAAFGEILRMIKEEEPPRPSTRLSDSGEALESISAQRHMEPAKLTKLVRGELDWIVMKCLEKDRNRRYETANGFADDVQRYLNDEPVKACPPRALYRIRKFARRNKAGLLLAATVITAMVLAIVSLSLSNVWVAAERDQKAEALRDKELALQKEIDAVGKARGLEVLARKNAGEAQKQQAIAKGEAARAKEQEDLARRKSGEAQKQQAIAKGEAARAKEQELLARRHFYASQINLAQEAWAQGQPARVLELLEGQRPRFDQTDLRTFEWYYLWQRCHRDCRLNLHLLRAPELSTVALAPDGKTLAAQWGSSDIKLWDLASGRERLTLKERSRVTCILAYAPDGQTLASGSFHRGDVILWDVSTGNATKTFYPGQRELRSLAFAPDGKILACGGGDGTLKLWNVAAGREEATLSGHTAAVLCLIFSTDGKTLASASAWGKESGVVNLWDMSTDPPKPRHRLGGTGAMAFSPDGKSLACGSPHAPGTVTLYDVATGQKRLVQDTNSGGVLSVAYSPDGKTLAIGNADRTLKLWTPESGRQHSYAHHNAVSWVAFSPDGNTVVSAGSRDDAVKVWDVVAAPEPATLHQKGAVYSVAFSPDGRMLACGGDRSTKLWDVATGREAATVPFGHRHGVGFTAFSHDGKTLAISSGTTVELIAVGDRQEPAPLQVQTTKVGSLPVSPADKSLVHDAGMNGFFVARLAFSPDDKSLAIAGYNVVAKVWDLATRQVRLTLEAAAVDFSADRKTLAAGRGGAGVSNGRVTLWDMDTLKEGITCQGERTTAVFCVQFSPDGKLVAQSTDYGTVMLWDVASGALHASLKGHTSPVNCVAFNPDGKTLASASADQTIKLWDVNTGQERVTLTGHTAGVSCVAFAPDGKTLASGSQDATVRLWRAAADQDAMAPRTELEPDEPEGPLALVKQGEVLSQSGQPALAAEAFREAGSRLEKLAAQFPRKPEYRRELAASYHALGSMWKAKSLIPEAEQAHHRARLVLEELVADFPDVNVCRYDLIFIQWCLGEMLDAAGRHLEAEQAYGRAIALEPLDPETWSKRASAYKERLEWDKARADYSKVIELDPRHALAWHNLGHVFSALSQREKAIAHYTRAIELMPESPSFWDHRGACYAELGRFAEAIADFSKEIELKPDDAVLWRLRARTQETAGRWNEAVADYSKTLELNPADWGVWDDRGMLFLSARQPEKALADFTKSIAIDPKVWWLWQHRSLAYRALDRWQEAIADLSMTVELAPQNAGASNDLAWLLATCSDPKVRDPNRALKAAKKTVELEPEKGMWWSTLGAAHYRAGDWKSAALALEKSMQLRNGGDANDSFFLAMAHWRLDHQEEAGKWYAQAVRWMDKNAPQNPELRRFRTEAAELLKKE